MRYLQKSDDRPRNLFSGPLEVKNKVNVFTRFRHKREMKDDRADSQRGEKWALSRSLRAVCLL
jgi:hypothetical protein